LFILIGFLNDNVWDTRYVLADLPWKKPWVWFLVFFTGPLGWICFGFSALHLRLLPPLRPLTPEQLPQVVTHVQTEYFDDDDDVGYEYSDDAAKLSTSYVSSPVVARAYYANLRMPRLLDRRQSRLETVSAKVAELRRYLKSQGEQIKETQGKISTLSAEERTLRAAMEEIDVSTDPVLVNEEFDRLLALPGIIAVQIVNERLRLLIRSVYHSSDGVAYDFGDWQMDIGPDVTEPRVYRLRNSVNPGWTGYPDYTFDDNSLCLGSRSSTIEEHLIKGQFLEAIALVVECTSSVNEDDVEKVPQAYPVLEV
jgi:hypothetical protein